MPTVSEIVEEYLGKHGYDGLYSGYGCYCLLDTDFMSCDNDLLSDCHAGYKHITLNGDTVCCKEITDIKDGHCIGCYCKCPVEVMK